MLLAEMFSKSLKNQKRQIGHQIFFARKKIKEDAWILYDAQSQ